MDRCNGGAPTDLWLASLEEREAVVGSLMGEDAGCRCHRLGSLLGWASRSWCSTWLREMLSMRLSHTEKRCMAMSAGSCVLRTVACAVAGLWRVVGGFHVVEGRAYEVWLT